MRRATLKLAIFLSLTLLACACGGVRSAILPASRSATGSWIASDAPSIIFAQLVEAKDGTLSGSANYVQAATTDTGDPSQQTNLSVSGVRRDDSLSLTLNAGLGVTQTWTGKLTDSGLALQIPQQNGSLTSVILRPGTSANYNEAVSRLRSAVIQQRQDQARVQQEQQAAQQQQQAAADLAKAQTALANAVQQVTKDLPGLAAQDQLPGKLQALNAALTQEASDYNATKALAGPSADCNAVSDSITKVSSAESGVSDASSALSSASGDLSSAASSVKTDVDSARQAIQDVQQKGGQASAADTQQVDQADKARQAASATADTAYSQSQVLYSQGSSLYGEASGLASDCNTAG